MDNMCQTCQRTIEHDYQNVGFEVQIGSWRRKYWLCKDCANRIRLALMNELGESEKAGQDIIYREAERQSRDDFGYDDVGMSGAGVMDE